MWRSKADWLRLCLPPLVLVTLFVIPGFRGRGDEKARAAGMPWLNRPQSYPMRRLSTHP